MLKSDFYTVHELQSATDSLSCEIVFNKAHKIFGGHFPQQPVVPGVCMIAIVKELLEQQTAEKLLLRSTRQVKFLQLITSDISPNVSVTWKRTDDGYLVNASFKTSSDLFKLTATMEVLQSTSLL